MIKSRNVGSEGTVAQMERNSYFNRALVTKPEDKVDDRIVLQPHFINGAALKKKVLRCIGGGRSRKC